MSLNAGAAAKGYAASAAAWPRVTPLSSAWIKHSEDSDTLRSSFLNVLIGRLKSRDWTLQEYELS
jgi:hypothetical protein